MTYSTQHGPADIPAFYSRINSRTIQSEWHTMLCISFTSDFLHLSTARMTEDWIMKSGVLLQNLHYYHEPHVVVINCLVGTSTEMKEQAGKRGSTANVPSSIAYPFKKCLWWVQLWMHSLQNRWLMGKELQSVTQLSASNRWYVLDQQNYMFRSIEAIIGFVQLSYKSGIHIMCTTAYQWWDLKICYMLDCYILI